MGNFGRADDQLQSAIDSRMFSTALDAGMAESEQKINDARVKKLSVKKESIPNQGLNLATKTKIKRANLRAYPSTGPSSAQKIVPKGKQPENCRKKPEGKRKRLRKRTKSRGHGTLDMLDLEHISRVNTERINIHKESIKDEFGIFGALPEGSKRLWNVKTKVTPHTSEKKVTKPIQIGQYRLRVKLVSSHMSLLKGLQTLIPGMDKKKCKEKCVHVKMWLLNKEYSHSKKSEGAYLSMRPGSFCDFDMIITPQDVKEQDMDLMLQITSTSSQITATVTCELHKIVLPPSSTRSSRSTRSIDPPSLGLLSSTRSSAYPSTSLLDFSSGTLDLLVDFSGLVLEGEDQQEHIKRTRRERARSVQLKALQKKEKERLREKEKRAKTIKSREEPLNKI